MWAIRLRLVAGASPVRACRVASFASPARGGDAAKKSVEEPAVSDVPLSKRRSALPELLGPSWVPPTEPQDKVDFSLLPHAIEAAPRAIPGAPLLQLVFSDAVVQSIKQLRFEREFFIWRKRFESPLTAAFKSLVDARTQAFIEKKRSWRREGRSFLKAVHYEKTAFDRAIRERRAFKFASPIPNKLFTQDDKLETVLPTISLDSPEAVLGVIGLSESDIDPTIFEQEGRINYQIQAHEPMLQSYDLDQEYAGENQSTYTVRASARMAYQNDKHWSIARKGLEKAGLRIRPSAAQFLLDTNLEGVAPDMTNKEMCNFIARQTENGPDVDDSIAETLREHDPSFNPNASRLDMTAVKKAMDEQLSKPLSDSEYKALLTGDIGATRHVAAAAAASSSSSASTTSLPMSSSGSESDSDSSSSSSSASGSDSDSSSSSASDSEATAPVPQAADDNEQLDFSDVRGALIHAGMKEAHADELYREFYHRFGIELEDAFDQSTRDRGLSKLRKLPHAEKIRKMESMFKSSPYEAPVRPEPLTDFDIEISRRTYYEPMGSLPTTLEERRVVMRVQLEKLSLPPVVHKRLVELVGNRFTAETGILKLVSDHYPNKQENTLNCMRLLRDLLEESFLLHPNFVPFSDLDVDPVTNAVTVNVPLSSIQAPPFSFIEYTERQEKTEADRSSAPDAVLFEEDLKEDVELLPFVTVRFDDIEEHPICDQDEWNKIQATL